MRSGHFMCSSKGAFDELRTALVNDDRKLVNWLVAQGRCAVTSGRIEASVLERGWRGWVKVRIYVEDDAAVVWTFTKALRE